MTTELQVPKPFAFTQVQRLGSSCLRRLLTVDPGMCGPTQALVARVGDWTWETVSAVCGLDVFNAHDAQGRPAYLSYYYYRITSGSSFHPRQLTFGDRLEVQSQVFDAGRRSVLTVHRLRRITGFEDDDSIEPFDVGEAHTQHRDDCLYIENLNMWISRGNADTNVGLVHSPPVGFDNTTLPKLPDAYSPRFLCSRARTEQTFPDPDTQRWVRSAPDLVVKHTVDVTQDVNGVGLLYFASFFSIAEHALLDQWRSRGRASRSFLNRIIRDARICYLGNADLDTTLSLHLRTLHDPEDPAEEKIDIAIRDIATDRTIAVAAFRHGLPASLRPSGRAGSGVVPERMSI